MRNKFNAKSVIIDGIRFDSTGEGKRYQELKLMWRAGLISGLELQVKFEVVPKTIKFSPVNYILDFQYYSHETNKIIYEDFKGCRTGAAYQVFKIKQKLMYSVHGIEVKEVGR